MLISDKREREEVFWYEYAYVLEIGPAITIIHALHLFY